MPPWTRGFTGTCSYPHGWITLFLQLVAIGALTCSTNVMWSCSYLQVLLDDDNDATTTSTTTTTTRLGIGFLRRQQPLPTNHDASASSSSSAISKSYLNQCVPWRSTHVDAPWIAGRVLSIVATALVAFAILIPLFMTCYVMTPRWLQLCSALYLLAAILEMLTLIALTSNLCDHATSCHAGPGFYYAISASVLQLFTGCLVRSIPPYGGTGHSARTLRDVYVPPVPGSIDVPENV